MNDEKANDGVVLSGNPAVLHRSRNFICNGKCQWPAGCWGRAGCDARGQQPVP